MANGFGNSRGNADREAAEAAAVTSLHGTPFPVDRVVQSAPTGSWIGRYPGRTTRRDRPPEGLRYGNRSRRRRSRVCRRAGGSLPRPAMDRPRPPDRVLRRTRGGRPARYPPTYRSRLSESTRHRGPSCANTAHRDAFGEARLVAAILASACGWRDHHAVWHRPRCAANQTPVPLGGAQALVLSDDMGSNCRALGLRRNLEQTLRSAIGTKEFPWIRLMLLNIWSWQARR